MVKSTGKLPTVEETQVPGIGRPVPMPRDVAAGDLKIYEAMIGRRPKVTQLVEAEPFDDRVELPRHPAENFVAGEVRAEMRGFLADARRTLAAASARLRKLRGRAA